MKEIKDLGIIRKEGVKRGYRYGLYECPHCGMYVEKIKKDGLLAKYCSHQCYAMNRQKRGAYKESIISRSYRYIYSPNHPHAIGAKKLYVAEHRLVMESYIGRYLIDTEVVHHKDENTLNNDINNLMLCTASEHTKLHIEKRRRGNNGQFAI